jgi:hypothetical protein
MNPYLEKEVIWHDFHTTFIPTAAEVLTPQVAPNYMVRICSRKYSCELSPDDFRFMSSPPESIPASDRRIESPVYGRAPIATELERESFLQVQDRESQQIVTVIELLSSANKTMGPGRAQYLGKREEILRSNVNLVEIDLLRGDMRLPLDGLPECDYYAMVSRPAELPQVGLWPIQLRDPLPIIPIPLVPRLADAQLDLQLVLNKVFDAAGYHFYVYDLAPQPPLRPSDAEWARQFLP